MRRTVPPSAEIQVEIDKVLSKGMVDDPQKMLSELARLGARLIIQRAVEDEFDTWLGRARYERRPERQRGLRNYDSGLRNGFRARHVQTGEGELRIEVPQARGAVAPVQLLVSADRRDQRQGRQAPPRGPDLRARASRLRVSRPLPRRGPRCVGCASALPLAAPRTVAVNEPARAVARRGPPAHQGDGPVPGRDQLPLTRLGARESKEDWLELGLYRIKYQQADPDTLGPGDRSRRGTTRPG